MSRNDGFFKILFAIELALIPMVIFAHMYLENWAMSLILGGIVVAKVWREIFKEKENKSHLVISAIASLIEFGVLIIYFATEKLLLLPLAISAVVVIVLFNLLKVVFANVTSSDTIEAVDFCVIIFELLALVAFAIMSFVDQIATISLWTLVLAGSVSVLYKIYFGFRYNNWAGRVRGFFQRLFRRK